MGIKFYCPNGHRLNVKSFLSGKKAICPKCGAKVIVPAESQPPPANAEADEQSSPANGLSLAEPDVASAASAAFRQKSTAAVSPANPLPVGAAPAPSAGPSTAQAFAAAAGAAVPVTAPATTTAVGAAETRDPIDEAPTAVWYVRPASGGQFGPAPGETMRAWIDEGRVNATALVWRAGWPEWRSAAAIFPKLAATVAAPWGAAPAMSVVPVGVGVPVAANAWGAAMPVNVAPVQVPGPGLFPMGVAMAPVQSAGGGGGLPVGQIVGDPDNPYLSSSDATDDRVARFRRKRRGRNDATMIVSVVLVVLTVVLVIVLAIVLNRQPGTPQSHQLPKAKTIAKPQAEAPAKLTEPIKKAPEEEKASDESMEEDSDETDE